MSQTIPATCVLGPGKTGLTIGLRVLNLDGTTYSAFSTTGVAETSVAGTYRKTGGVVCPDAGGYIVWGEAATDYAEATVDSTSVNVTHHAGEAVAAADANGNVPVVLYPTQGAVTFGQVKIAANVAGQGALDVRNSNAYGHGLYAEGGNFGLRTEGGNGGQGNFGTSYGQVNSGATGARNFGSTADVDGVDEAGIRAALGMAAADLDTQLDAIAASGGGSSAQEVWEYTTRTLTQSSTSTTDSTAAGSIARRRGDSWSISLTIGAITGYTSLWFTAKWDRDDTDISSVLQIKLNSPSASDGLLYVNGAAASDSAKGSITVSDDTTGAIIIAVDETITQYLPPAGLYYDIQVLNSGTVTTPDSGTLTITADVTRDVA